MTVKAMVSKESNKCSTAGRLKSNFLSPSHKKQSNAWNMYQSYIHAASFVTNGRIYTRGYLRRLDALNAWPWLFKWWIALGSRGGVVAGESTRLPPMWPGFDSWSRRNNVV